MSLTEFIESGFNITRVEDTITSERACSYEVEGLKSVDDLEWQWIDTESANEKDYYIVEYTKNEIQSVSPHLEYDEIDDFIAKL